MIRFLTYPLVILFLILTAVQVPQVFTNALASWKIYTPLIGGVLGYFVLSIIPFVSRNREHMITFSHEMTHWVFSLLFFRKLYSFQVESDNTGSITHSGGRIGEMFISLSPYCVPLFTVILLLVRHMVSRDYLVGFDVALGVTLGFHIGCFINYTGLYQSDIRNVGIFRSLVFIIGFWLFFAILILLSLKSDMYVACKGIFLRYWDTLVSFWQFVKGLL